MAFEPAQWLHHFVLPLVAGGDVRVQQVIGTRELKQLLEHDFARDDNAQRIAVARHAIVSSLTGQIALDDHRPGTMPPGLRVTVRLARAPRT